MIILNDYLVKLSNLKFYNVLMVYVHTLTATGELSMFNNAKNKPLNGIFLYRKEMERAHSCKSICNYYDLSTEQVIGVLQLVLCTWIAAIGC